MGIHIPDSFFSRDEHGSLLCPKCREVVAVCDCPVWGPPKAKTPSLRPVIRLERSGRKGKTVTVIAGLPKDAALLEDLSRKLKIKTGSGGTFRLLEEEGVIEIQGDQRKVIENIF